MLLRALLNLEKTKSALEYLSNHILVPKGKSCVSGYKFGGFKGLYYDPHSKLQIFFPNHSPKSFSPAISLTAYDSSYHDDTQEKSPYRWHNVEDQFHIHGSLRGAGRPQ